MYLLLFLFEQSKRIGLLQTLVKLFRNRRREFVYYARLQYILNGFAEYQIFQPLFGNVCFIALFLMKFTIKTFVVVVDLSRMACSVLGGHKRTAIAAKEFSAQYVRAMVLHSLLLVPLVIHYIITSLKGLFVHKRRYYVVIRLPITYNHAHILAVADYFSKGIDGKLRAALVVYAHIVQTIDYAFCFLAVLVSFEHIFYNRCFYGIYRPMLVYNVVTE